MAFRYSLFNSGVAFGLVALTPMTLSARAQAQEFSDTQQISNTVLFKRQNLAAQQRDMERRRVEDLDRRSQQQAALLQQQTIYVLRLSGELQRVKDEREVLDAANAFDASLAAGRWPALRLLLASEVTLDLPGSTFPVGATISPEKFVAALAASPVRGSVQPRSIQRVQFEADRATVTSEGYAWNSPSKADRASGSFVYRFQRTSEGWKLDGLSFRSGAP